jgi:hypothetical protein
MQVIDSTKLHMSRHQFCGTILWTVRAPPSLASYQRKSECCTYGITNATKGLQESSRSSDSRLAITYTHQSNSAHLLKIDLNCSQLNTPDITMSSSSGQKVCDPHSRRGCRDQ